MRLRHRQVDNVEQVTDFIKSPLSSLSVAGNCESLTSRLMKRFVNDGNKSFSMNTITENAKILVHSWLCRSQNMPLNIKVYPL